MAGGQNPIGARLRLGVLEQPPPGALIDASRGARRHHRRHRRQHAQRRLARRAGAGVVLPYSIVGAAAAAARGAHGAGDPNLLLNPVRARGAGDRSRAAARPPDHAQEVLGQEVVQPRFTMALFSAFAGARPGARRGRHLQRAVVPRHAAHARARRPHGARRPAPPRARADARRWARGWCSPASRSASSPASRATRLLRSQLFGVQADRSARLCRGHRPCSARSRSSPATSRRAAPPASTRWWRCGRTEVHPAGAALARGKRVDSAALRMLAAASQFDDVAGLPGNGRCRTAVTRPSCRPCIDTPGVHTFPWRPPCAVVPSRSEARREGHPRGSRSVSQSQDVRNGLAAVIVVRHASPSRRCLR